MRGAINTNVRAAAATRHKCRDTTRLRHSWPARCDRTVARAVKLPLESHSLMCFAPDVFEAVAIGVRKTDVSSTAALALVLLRIKCR